MHPGLYNLHLCMITFIYDVAHTRAEIETSVRSDYSINLNLGYIQKVEAICLL